MKKYGTGVIALEDFYTICDRAHFLFAYAVLLTFGMHYLWWTTGLVVIGSAVKEYWYDQNYETVEDRGSNTRDWLGYCAGCAFAIVVLFIKSKI